MTQVTEDTQRIIGYTVDYESQEDVEIEEVRTSAAIAQPGIVPWEIARRAVDEELGGIAGDINEGDAGGRLEEDPEALAKLETGREQVALLVPPEGNVFEGERKAVLDALVEDCDSMSYYEAFFHRTPALVQAWLIGERTLEDISVTAADEGFAHVAAAVASPPAPQGP